MENAKFEFLIETINHCLKYSSKFEYVTTSIHTLYQNPTAYLTPQQNQHLSSLIKPIFPHLKYIRGIFLSFSQFLVNCPERFAESLTSAKEQQGFLSFSSGNSNQEWFLTQTLLSMSNLISKIISLGYKSLGIANQISLYIKTGWLNFNFVEVKKITNTNVNTKIVKIFCDCYDLCVIASTSWVDRLKWLVIKQLGKGSLSIQIELKNTYENKLKQLTESIEELRKEQPFNVPKVEVKKKSSGANSRARENSFN